MTKREGYELVMTIKERPDMVDFAKHMIELMNDYYKNLASCKLTENQMVNEDIIKRKGE